MSNISALDNPCLKCEIHPDNCKSSGCKEYNNFRKSFNSYLDKIKSISISSKATPTRKRGSK